MSRAWKYLVSLPLIAFVAAVTMSLALPSNAKAYKVCPGPWKGWTNPYEYSWRIYSGLEGWLGPIVSAANTWTRYSDAQLNLRYAGTTSWYDDRNQVFTYDDFESRPDIPDTSDAQAFYWWDASGNMTRVYATINTRRWWNSDGLIQGNYIDIEMVSLHEFGHWMCIGDYPDQHPESIMWSQEGELRRQIRQDDKNGAQKIYRSLMGPLTQGSGLQAQVGTVRDWGVDIWGTTSWNYWYAAWGNVLLGAGGSRKLVPISDPGFDPNSIVYYISFDATTNAYGNTGTGYAIYAKFIDQFGKQAALGSFVDTTQGYTNRTYIMNDSSGRGWRWSNGSESSHATTSVRRYELWYRPSDHRLQWGIYRPPANGQMCSVTLPLSDNPYFDLVGAARQSGDGVSMRFSEVRVEVLPNWQGQDWGVWAQGCNTW